jgi:hypothetical protein
MAMLSVRLQLLYTIYKDKLDIADRAQVSFKTGGDILTLLAIWEVRETSW